MTNYREILRLSSLWYNNTEIADAYEKGSPLIIKTPEDLSVSNQKPAI